MAGEKHFVVLPFPAFGHIIPMLELAKKIRQQHKVTFVISAMKLPAIRERGLLPDNIPVVTLNDGLSDDYDKDLEPKQFKAALIAMSVPQKELFENLPISPDQESAEGPISTLVTGVIMDMMFSEAFQICHRRSIPSYLFSCAAAWTIVGGLHVDENTPTISDENFFKADPDTTLEKMQFNSSGIQESFKDMCLQLVKNYPLVKAVVINSFEDLEPTAKAAFESHPKSGGTPIKFVGPLFPDSETPNAVDGQVQSWLDKRKERSVVFVSFGSMAIPLPKQIAEISLALTELKKPFIWSLRASQYQHLPDWFRQLMEKGFDGEFLVLPWAPQKLILGHSSTQVFVSHCGWNSTLEGISSGIAFVGWPMFGDQYLNAELLIKLGNGVKISNTSVRAIRVVPKSEIMETILKVTEAGQHGEPNIYEKAAQELATKTRETISEGGKSYKDFQEMFG